MIQPPFHRRTGAGGRMARAGARAAPAALAAALIIAATITAPAALAAQEPVPTLDRVDSLVSAGSYDLARATLTRWWSARDEFDIPGSDRAHGLMLRARLATDLEAAESDYLAVVLGYPTSSRAAEALLRLGQGLLDAGDITRAAGYLRRLDNDYPGRPEHTAGLLWLARAETRLHRAGPACAAARAGLKDARDPDMAAMLRAEEESACAAAAVASTPAGDARPRSTPARTVPAATPPRGSAPRPAPQSRATPPAPERGQFSAQSGAFRYQRSVDALVARLEEAGYQPRVVRVPGSSLIRVRVGRFTALEPARAVTAELKRRGFDAVVVRDADREMNP